MKKQKVWLFFIMLAGGGFLFWGLQNWGLDRQTQTEAAPIEYRIPRIVRYGFTVQNTTGKPLKDITIQIRGPVKQTATQHCERIESSSPFRLISDGLGNQVLVFSIDCLPPYGTKILSIKADLMLSGKPNKLPFQKTAIFLKAEKYVESDAAPLRELAGQLSRGTHLATARNILDWVADGTQYTGYESDAYGAFHALHHRQGDCTAFMYLFAALCRASEIPARCMGGYVCREDMILGSADYHNWSEFYADGVWYLADPQRRRFMQQQADYVAMRIISPSHEIPDFAFDRVECGTIGIKVRMN